MAEYRKSKGGRAYFRIDGETVTVVIIKYYEATVRTGKNPVLVSAATDKTATIESSEEEFTKAHKEALATVSMMKII